LKRAKTIVATSAPYRDTSKPLAKWLDKCKVVPLGMDAERFGSAASSQDRKEALQVLAVGRLTYYKGFRFLIEAAVQTPDIHINLVGHGEQAEQLKSLVASLKLQDRVTFHGILSNDELAQEMKDCDCLCLPSIERTEAFGMVLLEAMYFGKATVISDVEGSGMGWVVDDNVTGIKVNPADTNALAGAFKRLAADREELARMGQRGREKFDQQFEINHAVEDLVKIYQHVKSTDPGNRQPQ
ncbi:MAG: glycosyltransferase, partial [Gammaproteobacteria bacterium]|nr:glycosyltransferase [Gammaproteobacteria bacterium]